MPLSEVNLQPEASTLRVVSAELASKLGAGEVYRNANFDECKSSAR